MPEMLFAMLAEFVLMREDKTLVFVDILDEFVQIPAEFVLMRSDKTLVFADMLDELVLIPAELVLISAA